MSIKKKLGFASLSILLACGRAGAADAALATSAMPATYSTSPRMIVVCEAILRNGFSIRYHHREVRQQVTRLYLSASPSAGYIDVPIAEVVSIQRAKVPLQLSASATDVRQMVSSSSDRHQVDADLVNSVIRAESGFNSKAVSPKGAQGLMQLMPETASQLGVRNAFEPAENIEGGTRYLRELLEQYNGDMIKALAAYNAGPHRVEQYGGVPPYRETHAYLVRVIRDFNRAKLAKYPELRKRPTYNPLPPKKTAALAVNNSAQHPTKLSIP